MLYFTQRAISATLPAMVEESKELGVAEAFRTLLNRLALIRVKMDNLERRVNELERTLDKAPTVAHLKLPRRD